MFLQQLSSGVTLSLSASRPAAKGKEVPAMERITKAVHVRTALTASGHTVMHERSVRQLSGGERRRVALALSLGFASLIASRYLISRTVMLSASICSFCPEANECKLRNATHAHTGVGENECSHKHFKLTDWCLYQVTAALQSAGTR